MDEASPRERALETRVARTTMNQALNRFLRLKRIERVGLGGSTRYRKTQNNKHRTNYKIPLLETESFIKNQLQATRGISWEYGTS